MAWAEFAQFAVFAVVLGIIALKHGWALRAALGGLAVLLALRLALAGTAAGAAELSAHLAGEWVVLANLFLLLLGFAVLANHFERSQAPEFMPRLLPDNWIGGLVLLLVVFLLSTFLDNIAGAMIGGVIARHAYRGRVRVGYLAAIVAAANAGGAGSVIGDTTTTMIWLSGVSPLHVADAFVGSAAALAVFGVIAARAQERFQPIVRHAPEVVIDKGRLAVVAVMLAAIVSANLAANIAWPGLEDRIPLLGLTLWAAIAGTSLVRAPDWTVLRAGGRGAVFLCALVATASLLPVERLPAATWVTTFGLGLVSSVFDNIPLTALAIDQGGYDWGLLAYAVGFGGSLIWFGSSAGVAITELFPEARSAKAWLRQGWTLPFAYAIGFAVMIALLGWKPEAPPP